VLGFMESVGIDAACRIIQRFLCSGSSGNPLFEIVAVTANVRVLERGCLRRSTPVVHASQVLSPPLKPPAILYFSHLPTSNVSEYVKNAVSVGRACYCRPLWPWYVIGQSWPPNLTTSAKLFSPETPTKLTLSSSGLLPPVLSIIIAP
jgi:hypothetical protein